MTYATGQDLVLTSSESELQVLCLDSRQFLVLFCLRESSNGPFRIGKKLS